MPTARLKPDTDAFTFRYTGKLPGDCPGLRADGTLASLPQLRFDAARAAILAYFDNGWTLSELLLSGLNGPAAFTQRPYHQLRLPMIFYYAHPAVLYANKLRVAGLFDAPINQPFEAIFETGVDEMRWDDLHDGEKDEWPPLEEVRAYRQQVYDRVKHLIETHSAFDWKKNPVTQQSPAWALVMAFEHERIHLETSSVLMRELPIEFVSKPAQWPSSLTQAEQATENKLIERPAITVQLGKPSDYPTFGWDNEYGSESRKVRPFEASSMLISNREFHAFVTSGGYADETYWSREGWAWRRFRNIKHPTFWVPNGPAGLHDYQLRTIFEVIPMQWDWPVCVNFHEAKAYCAWRTAQEESAMPYRLLTEAEHHALRDGETQANHGLANGSESPVAAFPANAHGIHDVFGNVWQWCEDHFHPLTGSAPHPYYDDFSAPCYDGEHQMILGGSFISTGDEASPFARFHFRPHFFQHAGLRVVRNTDGNPATDARRTHTNGGVHYESESWLNRYLAMHFASDDEIFDSSIFAHASRPAVENLPHYCAELILRHTKGRSRVLDVGCAVGGSSFHLARVFQQVIGVDYSDEFIRAATYLQQHGAMPYQRKDSGTHATQLTANVDAAIDRSRVRFEQGDACALPLHLSGFDAVLLANVLCRLSDPEAALARMQGSNALVKPGGTLVMTTPLSWLEEYTPPARWLNGIADIARILTDFELIHQAQVPFVIREHARKFEYIVTEASVWRRKA